MNIFKEWQQEWSDAKKFFESKGNIKTKSKLKDIWYKNFKDRLYRLEKEVRELGGGRK